MMGGGIGRAVAGVCPPGFLCMDTSTMLFGLLLAIVIVAGIIYLHSQQQQQQQPQQQQKPQIVVVKTEAPRPAITVNSDPRFAPMPPEQSYNTPVDNGFPIPAGLGALPVNSYTRGAPGAFQQVGVLTAPGGTETSGSPTRTILPLFGRSIDSNRNRWNYYTRSDGINPVQLPLQFKRRNCDDDNGCDEVSDGDSVGVPVLGNSFTVSLYKYSTPRYLPI
jgi:Family of unknown function (DUF5755)